MIQIFIILSINSTALCISLNYTPICFLIFKIEENVRVRNIFSQLVFTHAENCFVMDDVRLATAEPPGLSGQDDWPLGTGDR